MKTLEGFKSFKESAYPGHKELFEKLGNGQQPHTLVVTCSDSRIDPALICQSNPGDIFVVRNAGNVINNKDMHSSEVATIEYAIQALGIKEILILGHASCGAVAAKCSGVDAEQLPHIHAYLELVDNGGKEGEEAIVENVKSQVSRFCELPFVSPRLEAGELTVSGSVYDFVNGELSEVVRRS